VRAPVTTITLNRRECHNALDREVSAEFHAAVVTAEKISEALRRGEAHAEAGADILFIEAALDAVKNRDETAGNERD
jgi:2-methylisocitrate lyase-like PEP mutase family enzyme